MLHRSLTYPTLSKETFLPHLLFFDIETTGLSARYDHVALISLGRQRDEHFVLDQYLAESEEEEGLILISALKALQDAPLTITFNGNRFDIPFINQRLHALHQGWQVDKERSLDLYRVLGKGKLQQNEAQSGYLRTDTLSGKAWAEHYKNMLQSGSQRMLEELLLHNAEDVYALYHLLSHRPELMQMAKVRIYDLGGVKTLKKAIVGKEHVRVILHSPLNAEEIIDLPLTTYHQFKIYAHPQFDELNAEQKKMCFLVEDSILHLDRLHTLLHLIEKQKI